MRRPRCLLVLLALVAVGCANETANELSGPGHLADAAQLARAAQVARAYLDAAADADGQRLCALRTARAPWHAW